MGRPLFDLGCGPHAAVCVRSERQAKYPDSSGGSALGQVLWRLRSDGGK